MKTIAKHVKRSLEAAAPEMQPRRPEPQGWNTRRINAARREATQAFAPLKDKAK